MTIWSIPQRHPFVFGVGITAIKTAGMDLIVQFVQKKGTDEEIDKKRVLTFGLFGLAFNGAWQYALYVKLMPMFLPNAFAFAAKPIKEKMKDIPGIKAVILQNFIENGINNQILYFPCFYAVQAYVEGVENCFQHGIAKYKKNWKEDLIAIWSVWVPAQAINFAFSPPWFRVPFVAVVSCLWTGIVSFMRGGQKN